MRLDTENRGFFGVVAVTLVPYALLGLFGCGLLSVVAYPLTTKGVAGLHEGGQDLRPALAFFAIVAAGTVLAARSVRRQVQATRWLAASVAAVRLPTDDDTAAAAGRAGLAGRVDIVDDDRPFSFAFGLVASRVAISRGLLKSLDEAELGAVLAHERYHVRNRDPAKVVVTTAAASAFFVLPVLHALRDRYLAGRELAADRHAMRDVGVLPLAGALAKVLDAPTWTEPAGAAALGGAAFLDQRVEQLEEDREPARARLPPGALWGSAAALVALIALAIVAAVVSGGASASSSGVPRTSGAVGAMFSIAGGLTCSCAWAAVAVVVYRRVIRHERLTSRAVHTTTRG